MPRDLTSKRLIVLKGVLFGVLMLLAAGLIFWERPSLALAALLAVLVWSSWRFYYFVFYVLHAYVDPSLKYSGIGALARSLLRRKETG
jgi:hypothetical protein